MDADERVERMESGGSTWLSDEEEEIFDVDEKNDENTLEERTDQEEKPIASSTSIWIRAALFVLVQLFGALFLYLFSALPYCIGDRIHLELRRVSWLKKIAMIVSFSLLVILYMLDARYWHGRWRWVRDFMLVVMMLCFSITALLMTADFPLAPIALFLFGTPFFLMGIRTKTCMKTLDIVYFLRTMRWALILLAVLSLSGWVAWLKYYDANWRNPETKLVFYLAIDCEEGRSKLNMTDNIDIYDLYDEYDTESWFIDGVDILNDDVNATQWKAIQSTINEALEGCQAAFLLWLLPALLAIWASIFAGVLSVVAGAVTKSRIALQEGGRKKDVLDPMARAFLFFVGVGVIGAWAAAGIADQKLSFTIVVLSLAFLAMIISGVVVIAVFGISDLLQGLTKTPLGSRLVRIVKSDWLRAGMVILVGPFFAIFVFFSALRQASRKLFCCTKKLTEEQKKNTLTHAVKKQLTSFRCWNWGSVLHKILWIGIIYFLFMVGVIRVTTLLMSQLNIWLQHVPLSITTVIFILVGLTMFLLPPVPGVPVYVAGGVILVQSASQTMKFSMAIVFTVLVCFFIKLAAIVIQQKVIGEMLASKSVWVRSFVGVNSLEIRAIRHILEQPGMTMAKVAVLCGGPDWPVSVLTGILRQNVFAMLYGSLPVFFLVCPMVLAGAMLLHAGDKGPWSALAPIMLALAFLVQGFAFLYAIHFIAKTIVQHEEELISQPNDEEVLQLEETQAEKKQVQATVSHWANLKLVDRVILLASSFTMILSCYMFQLFGNRCFVPFSVNDTIEEKLGGRPLRLVRPLGWVALSMFALASVGLAVFNRRIKTKVKRAMEQPEELRVISSYNPRHPSWACQSDTSSETSGGMQRQMLKQGGESTRTIDLEGHQVPLEERAIAKAVCSSFLFRNFFRFTRG